jgi:hypothetical protein
MRSRRSRESSAAISADGRLASSTLPGPVQWTGSPIPAGTTETARSRRPSEPATHTALAPDHHRELDGLPAARRERAHHARRGLPDVARAPQERVQRHHPPAEPVAAALAMQQPDLAQAGEELVRL